MANTLLHIFRSQAGVAHVDATAGIGSIDATELEREALGILASAGELSRNAPLLGADPIVMGRRLRSGRVAVTRVMPAVRQEDGSDAIEIVSLVMPSRGYAQTAGSLVQIAFDDRFWRLARLTVTRGIDLPESTCAIPATDGRALRAFDAWIAARRRKGVAVLPPSDAPGILAMVAALDPNDRSECRWGIGVLNLDGPFDVCTISPLAGLASARPMVQAALDGKWLSAEMEHAVWHLGSNPCLPPLRTLVGPIRVESVRRGTAGLAPNAAAIESSGFTGGRTHLFLGACGAVALLATLMLVLRSGEPTRDPAPESDAPDSRAVAAAGSGRVASPRKLADPGAESVLANSSDVDGDGVRDDLDCDPQDPRRSVLQVFYRDFDGDGAGDPDESLAMRSCVLPDAAAPGGYARRNDDLCDQNPALTSNGGCPCQWPGAIEDLDGNGVLDCLDDLDHDGKCLADDPLDDRVRYCTEIAENFVRARREFALADSHLDEIDAILRNAALQRDLKGAERRAWERSAVGGQLAHARVAMRTGLWEVYVARRLVVFGDEAFQPRSQLDERQAAPDVFAVARPEQFEPLRILFRDVEAVAERYARLYARHIHIGRPSRIVRDELANEVLGEWLRNQIGPNDSLEAMKWVSGLLAKSEGEMDQEVRRLDDQMLNKTVKARAARPKP